MNRLFSTVTTVRRLIAFRHQPSLQFSKSSLQSSQTSSTVSAASSAASVKSDQIQSHNDFRMADSLTQLEMDAEKSQNQAILGKIEADVERIWRELPQLKQSTEFYQEQSSGYLGRHEEQQKTHNLYEELYKTTLMNGVRACRDAIALIDSGMSTAYVKCRKAVFVSKLEYFRTELRIATEKYEKFLSRQAEERDSYFGVIQRLKARANKLPGRQQVPVYESIKKFHFY